MGFWDIGKILSKVGQGIHKATSFGQKIYDGVGKGLDFAKKVADVASNIPLLGGPIRSVTGGVFSTVEGARQGLRDVLNIGNMVGSALSGVKVPSGPAIPGVVEQAPQAPRSAPTTNPPAVSPGQVSFDANRWEHFTRALRSNPQLLKGDASRFIEQLRTGVPQLPAQTLPASGPTLVQRRARLKARRSQRLANMRGQGGDDLASLRRRLAELGG